MPRPEDPADAAAADVGEDVEAVLLAARVLVAVSAQSVAAVDDVVTLPQLRILVMVASRGAMNLGAVAAGLGVHPSNATRAVERLVVAGLLDRSDDPADRRNLVLELTGPGRDLVERVMALRRTAVTAILDRMPAGRRRALVPVLRSFAAAAGETADDAVWSLGWTTTPTTSRARQDDGARGGSTSSGFSTGTSRRSSPARSNVNTTG